jgi:RNA polymerase sigma factor (sigma-70 family)
MTPSGHFHLVLTAEFPHNPRGRASPRRVATDHLYSLNEDAIEGVLKFVCRKKGLRDDRADEFCQWTRFRLIANDCGILRSFKGESSFKTFLVTVIQNKYRDWLDAEQGKFRVTAEAKELGPVAANLELLILRDKMPFDEAAQLLVSKGVATSLAQCDEVWGQLKRAPRRDLVSDEALENHQASPSLDPVEDEERQRLTRKVHAALVASIAALPPADNLILRLKYWDHVSVANIAKLQQTEQKPLYRRIEQLLKRLERDMAARGVTEDEVRDLFHGLGIDVEEFAHEGGK